MLALMVLDEQLRLTKPGLTFEESSVMLETG